ncbi:MAG: beta-N-acetylhexosaminidase [Candidatus Cryptobacteroides sp.]|nr:beta-N-acetylhexosaminidase [Bacteroidales bacterium]MDD7134649.1 beta-N-acetylhexosaminidase [Bacteroidales bacterium]MDY2773884.1 beta-N-acetylhexosaminidase [Candidatus Cryptobacteroides sp.]
MILKSLAVSTIAALAISASFSVTAGAVSIIPEPQKITQTQSVLPVSATEIKVYASTDELKQLAATWAESIKKPFVAGDYWTETNFHRIVSDVVLPSAVLEKSARKADVRLSVDKSLAEEQYRLTIDPKDRIVITGGSAKGVWWGLQSLSQILIDSASKAEGGQLKLAGLEIEDWPEFAYRGAMLDCCRHFIPFEDVKKYIDIMAYHKLNTFHWHLTEDQGWRIEIKKYPLLTEIGSKREDTLVNHLREKEENRVYDGHPHSGFYTQEQARELVAYAAARQITVIPEIEMPGHAEAALASYPYLGCRQTGYVTLPVWGVIPEVFCMGRESTFKFFEDVLDEICEIFPGEYIHIGGDECPRDRWKECPDCQRRMKEEGLTEVGQLQGYQLKRVEKYLNAKGRHIIGWDEILESGATPTATVMSWRGPQGGVKAAKMGNKVVMAPNNYFYLDYYQTADPEANKEPLGIGGYVSLEKCWSFDPFDQLTEKEKSYIYGIQANTWTEYMRGIDRVQFMDLPRFCALSAVSWHKDAQTYPEFLAKVKDSMLKLYQYYGLIYAPYAFEE